MDGRSMGMIYSDEIMESEYVDTTKMHPRTVNGNLGAFKDATYASPVTRWRRNRAADWIVATVIGILLAMAFVHWWAS
jgi:hypothetical protein